MGLMMLFLKQNRATGARNVGASGPGTMRVSGTTLKVVGVSGEQKGFPSLSANFLHFLREVSWGEQKEMPRNRRLLPPSAAASGSVQE